MIKKKIALVLSLVLVALSFSTTNLLAADDNNEVVSEEASSEAVSGATFSSKAIKSAYNAAIAKAKG